MSLLDRLYQAKRDAEINSARRRLTPTLERVAFRSSPRAEFCSPRELVAQTGHAIEDWPLVMIKEPVDNALDAAEGAQIPPEIDITVCRPTAVRSLSPTTARAYHPKPSGAFATMPFGSLAEKPMSRRPTVSAPRCDGSSDPARALPVVNANDALADGAWFDRHRDRRFRSWGGDGGFWLIQKRHGVFLRTFTRDPVPNTDTDAELGPAWFAAAYPELLSIKTQRKAQQTAVRRARARP